jgi:hypothetical protein
MNSNSVLQSQADAEKPLGLIGALSLFLVSCFEFLKFICARWLYAPLTQHRPPQNIECGILDLLDAKKISSHRTEDGRLFVDKRFLNELRVALIEENIVEPENKGFYWLYANPDHDGVTVSWLPEAYILWEKEIETMLETLSWVQTATVNIRRAEKKQEAGKALPLVVELGLHLFSEADLNDKRAALLSKIVTCRVPLAETTDVQISVLNNNQLSDIFILEKEKQATDIASETEQLDIKGGIF